MKLKKKDKIRVNNEIFIVISIREINFTHTEIKKIYYNYLLKSDNNKITYASLNYISDSEIIFHLTKKVNSEIKEKIITIENENYKILSHDIGIFMDYGEHKNVHEYKLESSGGKLYELHILPNNIQILHLNEKITSNEVKKIKIKV